MSEFEYPIPTFTGYGEDGRQPNPRLRKLEDALERYGRHHDWCSKWPEQGQPCDCGFANVLKGLGMGAK